MAKRFQFRLETVLKVRLQKEDEKKRVVAGRIRELVRMRELLMQLNEQIAASVKDARASILQPRVDVELVSRKRFWTSHLQARVMETELQIKTLENGLADDRRTLAEAAKEVRVMEKLREQAFGRYDRELQRAETLEADELSTQRFVNRICEMQE